MTTYDFKNFEYIDSIIKLPQNTILYRGVNETIPDDQILRDYPMYLSSKEIAIKYGRLYTFQTIKEIKLLDLRKIINLLPMIINTREYDISEFDILNEIQYLIIGLGFTSYKIQYILLSALTNMTLSKTVDQTLIDIMNQSMSRMQQSSSLKSPMELARGVRIGEITVNGHVVTVLKELFSNICDGYIAPNLSSPYHIEGYVHNEIVIFEPKDKLQIISIQYDPEVKDIMTLVENLESKSIKFKNKIDTSIKIGGKNNHELYDRNLFFINNKEEYTKCKQNAKKLLKYINTGKKNITSELKNQTYNIKYF